MTSLLLRLSGTQENNHTCLKTRQQALQNQGAVSEMTINMQVKVELPNFLDLDSTRVGYTFYFFSAPI